MSKHKKSLAKSKPTEPKRDTSPQVPQRDKIDWELAIKERNDLTEKQRALVDLILDKSTNIVFINGPAGTAKTWTAIYCGLLMLKQRRISHLDFVRTVVESASRSLGFLPGEQNEKMSPYATPLMDKLEELLSPSDVKRLMAEKRAVSLPVNYMRGASLNAQYIILEEAQNYTVKELTTALTRQGKYSKTIVIGDDQQSDLPKGMSGFQPLFDWFNQPSYREHGIYCISFTKDDIVRSGIVKIVVEAIEAFNAQSR